MHSLIWLIVFVSRGSAADLDIQSAKFNDDASGFHIQFNGGIKLHPSVSFLDARSLLTNLFPDDYDVSMIESTAEILDADPTILAITLYEADVVFPFQSYTIDVSILEPLSPDLYAFNGDHITFTVDNADDPLSPIPIITTFKDVGLCSDIVLRSFLSSNFGYRAPFITWSSPQIDLLSNGISDSDPTIVVPVESTKSVHVSYYILFEIDDTAH